MFAKKYKNNWIRIPSRRGMKVEAQILMEIA
jgi:hypothetical protein